MSGSKKNTSYFIDTNIFLRVITQDTKAASKDCAELIIAIEKGSLQAYTSNFVLFEINFVLTSLYGYKKQEVVEILSNVLHMRNLAIIDDYNLLVALDFYSRYSVKFGDCLHASSKRIQEGKAIIVSYDSDFDKLNIKRFAPADLIKNQP